MAGGSPEAPDGSAERTRTHPCLALSLCPLTPLLVPTQRSADRTALPLYRHRLTHPLTRPRHPCSRLAPRAPRRIGYPRLPPVPALQAIKHVSPYHYYYYYV